MQLCSVHRRGRHAVVVLAAASGPEWYDRSVEVGLGEGLHRDCITGIALVRKSVERLEKRTVVVCNIRRLILLLRTRLGLVITATPNPHEQSLQTRSAT